MKGITVWEKNALHAWMKTLSSDDLAAKLMYVLKPDQMAALIKLHNIKVVQPIIDHRAALQKTIKKAVKKVTPKKKK